MSMKTTCHGALGQPSPWGESGEVVNFKQRMYPLRSNQDTLIQIIVINIRCEALSRTSRQVSQVALSELRDSYDIFTCHHASSIHTVRSDDPLSAAAWGLR